MVELISIEIENIQENKQYILTEYDGQDATIYKGDELITRLKQMFNYEEEDHREWYEQVNDMMGDVYEYVYVFELNK